MKKGFIISAVSLLVLCACSSSGEKPEKVIPVGAVQVKESALAYSKSYVGQVTAKSHHLILCPHMGTIQDLDVRVGQKVAQGQKVAKVNAPNVNSMYRSSQATLRQAEDGYARAKKVYEAGGLSEIKWMDVQTKLTQAQSAAEISQKSLDDCVMTSPSKGTVSEVYVTVGSDVNIGSRIAMIIDDTALEVAIAVPESEYSILKEGEGAEVVVQALDYAKVKATISSIDVNTAALSHSYSARLSLKDYPKDLKSGMACKVYLTTSLHEQTSVPAAAVKTDDHGRYVWVVNKDSRVEKRRVVTKGYVGDGVAVGEGLCGGDVVIVRGISKVSTGMKVSVELL